MHNVLCSRARARSGESNPEPIGPWLVEEKILSSTCCSSLTRIMVFRFVGNSQYQHKGHLYWYGNQTMWYRPALTAGTMQVRGRLGPGNEASVAQH